MKWQDEPVENTPRTLVIVAIVFLVLLLIAVVASGRAEYLGWMALTLVLARGLS